MIRGKLKPNNTNWVLWIFLCVNFLGLIYYIIFFIENQYLPSPFVFDKTNTFMDLFNTIFWSNVDGSYSVWKSVYPPLVFLFLKVYVFITLPNFYILEPEYIRSASLYPQTFFLFLSTFQILLIFKLRDWASINVHKKIAIFFFFFISSPWLFVLERGNILALCPLLLSVAISSQNQILKMICIGLLINIKPYFAILTIYYLAMKNHEGWLKCVSVTGLIFVFTGLIISPDSFLLLFENLLSFSQNNSLFNPKEILALPSSVTAFSYVLNNPQLEPFLSSSNIIFFSQLAYAISFLNYFLIGLAFCIILWNKKFLIKGAEVLTILIIIISNSTYSVGGYSLILYFSLIPTLMRMKYANYYLAILGLIFMPSDMIILKSFNPIHQLVYLSGESVDVIWSLGLGSLLRPILNLLLFILIIFEVYQRLFKSRLDR